MPVKKNNQVSFSLVRRRSSERGKAGEGGESLAARVAHPSRTSSPSSAARRPVTKERESREVWREREEAW